MSKNAFSKTSRFLSTALQAKTNVIESGYKKKKKRVKNKKAYNKTIDAFFWG